jgi:AraC family transcriptional regulator
MSGLLERSGQGRSVARKLDVPPGGGAFVMPRLTIGIFLVGQASHRFAVGSDRKAHLPLRADDGWILPTGSSGICEFDEDHSFLTLELSDSLMDEVGFDRSRGFAPVLAPLTRFWCSSSIMPFMKPRRRRLYTATRWTWLWPAI